MPVDTSKYPDDFAELLKGFSAASDRHMAALQSGKLTPQTWYLEMKNEINTHARAARLLGNGKSKLGYSQEKVIEQWVEAQANYLGQWRAEMIKNPQAIAAASPARARMYGAATYTQYWEGKTEGLALPAMPGQGTQCLGNCKCRWEIQWISKKNGDADCYWRLGVAEHCQTCEIRAAEWNPVRIRGGNLEAPENLPPTAPGALPRSGVSPAGQATTPFRSFDELNAKRDDSVARMHEYDDGREYIEVSDHGSLDDYTGSAYEKINEYLRHPAGFNRFTKHIDEIDDLFAGVPGISKDTFVIRAGYVPPGLKVGSRFADDAFVSTSVNTKVPIEDFLGPGDAVYVIRLAKGTKVLPVNGFGYHPNEEEILLNRSGTFTIRNIEYNRSVSPYKRPADIYYVDYEG